MSRNKYPEVTEARILDAAEKLFLEKGWEKTTIQDVVEELGDLTKGAVYHHFKCKLDIIDAVTTRMFRKNNPFEQAKALPGTNGLQKIRQSVKISISDPVQVEMAKSLVRTLSGSKIVARQVEDCVQVLAPFIQKFIEEGNADGSLSVAEPRQAAETFLLLSNVWLNPLIFAVPVGRYRQKLKHLQALFNGIGMPVFDDSLVQALLEFYQKVS